MPYAGPPARCVTSPTIDLWSVSLSEGVRSREWALELLAADELERARGFRDASALDNFAITRAALRVLLATQTGGDPRAVQLAYGPAGRPEFPAEPGLRFSVSHTAGVAIIGLARDFSIGVDVEARCDPIRARRLASRFLPGAEAKELLAREDEALVTAFLCAWTATEAVVKTLGGGLVTAPGASMPQLGLPQSSRRLAVPHCPAPEGWALHHLELAPCRSVACVAVAAPEASWGAVRCFPLPTRATSVSLMGSEPVHGERQLAGHRVARPRLRP